MNDEKSDEDHRPTIEWMESAYSGVGRIMRVAALAEFRIGMILADYYDIPGRKRGSFTAAITSRLGFRMKIDALRTVLRETEMLDSHAETMKGLTTLAAWRNLAAHGIVGNTDRDESIIAFLIAKPGRPTVVEATAEMLQAAAESFHEPLMDALEAIEKDLETVPSDWHPGLLRTVSDEELKALLVDRDAVVPADEFIAAEQADPMGDDD
jgi:hypothetical protein